MKIISLVYKAIRKGRFIILSYSFTPYAKLIFNLNGVSYKSNLKVLGCLKVFVSRRGKVNIGNNCRFNSGHNFNIIGRQQKCIFWVDGTLSIGNNVGLSSTAIICKYNIVIGNNVVIGGNTVIYDTDFHSLDFKIRNNNVLDKQYAKCGQVVIHDNVFIGAHTTILKGVIIGNNAIIGACSVVTKNIPANEIWAGNPARFIKSIDSIDEK